MHPVIRSSSVARGLLCACLVWSCTADKEFESAERGPTEDESALKGAQRERGALLRAHALRRLSTRDLRRELGAEEFDASAVAHPVALFQLIYTTIDPEGRPTSASGLYAEPENGEATLTLVSYAHGTELYKGDAPSLGEDAFITGPALTFAASGFAAVAPDYLGLGAGPGVHPYMHLPSEVSASLDLLRAARTFALERGRMVERSVLVSGFSQGSFAALGLARALVQEEDAWFRLGALAPVSGPYDTRSWLRAALDGEVSPKDATMYLAYLSVAYDRLYDLYDSPAEFFRAPYDRTLPNLLDNTHEGPELFMSTPDTPRALLTPEALARYADPDAALAEPIDALAGVCSAWSPGVPVRLYAARGDEQVPLSNSDYCRRQFQDSGVETELVDLGDVSHLGSNVLAAAEIVRFFAELPR